MPSIPTLILGESGSGKSTSLMNLDPKETFLIKVKNKPLPFKKGLINYKLFNRKTSPEGNMVVTNNYDQIEYLLNIIETDKPDVNTIVIDDSQYLITDEYLGSVLVNDEKGFSIYNHLAAHFWKLIDIVSNMKKDLFIFFLHHIEISDTGKIQPKTIGRLLNEKLGICGSFTIVLLAKREGDENVFYTQNDGTHPAKSPIDMFESVKIPNDLQLVKESISTFYEGVQYV